jgi:hypothetical protein
LKDGALKFAEENFIEFCELLGNWKWGDIGYVGSQAVKGVRFHIMVDLINPAGQKMPFKLITNAYQYDNETKLYSYKFDSCHNNNKKVQSDL